VHRPGRGRGSRSSSGSASRGGGGGGSAGNSGPGSSVGEDSDGGCSRLSISSDGAQRSIDSLQGCRSLRPPVALPLAVRVRPAATPLTPAAAAAGAAQPEAASCQAVGAGGGGNIVSPHPSSPGTPPLRPASLSTPPPAVQPAAVAPAAPAAAAAEIGTSAAQEPGAAPHLPPHKPPASAAAAAVRRSRSEPGSGPTVIFGLPGRERPAPGTKHASAEPPTLAAASRPSLWRMASEPSPGLPGQRRFRMASAPAAVPEGVPLAPEGLGSSLPNSPIRPACRSFGSDSWSSASGHSAGGAGAHPSALPALAVNVAARAAVLAKAIPGKVNTGIGNFGAFALDPSHPPSPTSIFERTASATSTEWSGSSRRPSPASSVASACRAAVIAASLNAAIDQHGCAGPAPGVICFTPGQTPCWHTS